MAVSREEIIEALKEMSLLEASELVKDIEETFGVSAAAPVAVAAAPAAGRTAFPAYLAGSRGSNGRTAAAGLHGLLCPLGHRGGIHGSPDQIGAIRHRRYAAASLSGYSPPRTRHGRRDRAARPDSAFLFPGRHLCRRHQTPLHPLL